MGLTEDQARVKAVLEQNKHLNFVQRVLNKDIYPDIEVGKGRGTHLMSWGEDENGAYVFPLIVQQQSGAPLVRLDADKANAYAHQSGEMIRFPKKEDADWFSSNYKAVWPFMDR